MAGIILEHDITNTDTQANKPDPKNSETEIRPRISIRWLFAVFGLFIYVLLTMVKNSFAVTIVAMVNSSTGSNDVNSSYYMDTCPAASNASSSDSSSTEGDFTWSTSLQGQILSAYIWGMFIGRALGGRFGELFGQRLVVAIGISVGGVLELLSPVAANLGPFYLYACRFIMGLFHGPTYPAYHSLMSRWAPRQQLGSMLGTAFAGAPIGSMIGLITAGLIVDTWGWQWVFWSEGIVTLVFIPFWIFLVRNDPKDHPYITPYESKILDQNKNVVVKKEVPWLKILTSPYVYVCILGQFSRGWLDGIQNAEGPTFFSKKIGLSLSAASLVTGIANIIGLPAIVIYGIISDVIIAKKYVSTLTARKIMHLIGAGGPCLVCLAIAFANCNAPMVITFFLLYGVVVPALACSINVSVIDFGPNYAGTLMGLLGLGNIGGSISPMVASTLAETENGWNKTFFITAGISLANCLVYLFFMTDQPQSWNYYEGKKKKKRLGSKDSTDVATVQEHQLNVEHKNSVQQGVTDEDTYVTHM